MDPQMWTLEPPVPSVPLPLSPHTGGGSARGLARATRSRDVCIAWFCRPTSPAPAPSPSSTEAGAEELLPAGLRFSFHSCRQLPLPRFWAWSSPRPVPVWTTSAVSWARRCQELVPCRKSGGKSPMTPLQAGAGVCSPPARSYQGSMGPCCWGDVLAWPLLQP